MEGYYSRINSSGEKELLEDHLRKTSEFCEQFTSKFGMPVTGRVIGRLHDIGKHTKKFQEVLFGERTGVNHAIVGGIELKSIFQNYWPDIAYITASHHHGLEKNWAFEPNFSRSHSLIDMDNKENALTDYNEFEAIRNWMDSSGLSISQEEADMMCSEFQKFKGKSMNEQMFINRMIFSCLVDSDYSASGSFEFPNYYDIFDGERLNALELIDKLTVYRKKLIKNSKSNSKLNELRNQVYDDCVSKGKGDCGNYTLTAPAGTGKTLAMLVFALEHAKVHNKDRIIFVLPYLSIIEQNANIYREICGEDIVLEDDSQTTFDDRTRVLSERWSSPIIVTTSVKFFETLFRYKGTDLRKLHNICNSVIVFDEAQTLPFDILDSSMELVDTLNKRFGVTTLFSTATQPSFNYRKNIDWNATEIISNPQALYNHYNSIKMLKVNWMVNTCLSSNDLLDIVRDKKSFLCIFNLKRHANEFFSIVKENLCESQNNEVFYISTNLCSAHRMDLIEKINKRLKAGLPTKVISTQCLEAGVDLDFQYVYRAFGPATSIVQAAGRTSRNALRPGELTIFVPDGDRIYPDNIYKKSAQQLNILLRENGYFDINSLSDIDNYYRYLFSTSEIDSDSRTLLKSIHETKYKETSDNYKLIRNEGVTIIVPYTGKMDLYKAVYTELHNNGNHISKKIMAQARTVTVTSYDKKSVEAFCEKLCFRVHGEDVPCGWYILSAGTEMYTDSIGLYFEENDALLY